tara:strand:- start:2031 stop:3302 length:1272 start_codon:yes stop_codon:yes gene_type:complete
MAIADLLRNFGGKVGDTFANMGSTPLGNLTPEQQRRQNQMQGLRNLGEQFQMLGAMQSNRPQQAAFIQNQIKQREIDARNQQLRSSIENDESIDPNLKILMGQNPELYGRHKLSLEQEGRAKSAQLEEENRLAEMQGLKQLRQKQALQDIGLTETQISLFQNAGMTMKDIQALSDPESDIKQKIKEKRMIRASEIQDKIDAGFNRDEAIAIVDNISDRFLESDDKQQSLEDIRKEVNNARNKVDDITNKAPADDLANLKDAHGSYLLGDAFQENIFNLGARKIFGSEPADETGAAVRGKRELDERILQITTQNYSGRPSVFLLEQIKGLIPPINTSDKDAGESYSKIFNRVNGYLKDLEREIQSGSFKGTDLINLKTDYRRIYSLSKDLETAVGGLFNNTGVSIGVKSNSSKGQYDNFYNSGQ